MDEINLGLAIAAGLLSFISPCVLPLVPAYIGYMGGRVARDFALESAARTNQASRMRMLLHGLAFVFGFTLVFVLIGFLTTALASIAGQFVGALTETIGRVGGAVLVLFGLQFMGVVPRILRWLRGKGRAALLDNPLFSIGSAVLGCALIAWAFAAQMTIALALCAGLILALAYGGAFTRPARFWANALDRGESLFYADTRADISGTSRGGLLGSAFMGMVFSAGWTPCIGPLLGAILTLAASSGASGGDIAGGMILLAAYSIGLGIPFVFTALLLDNARALLRRLQRRMVIIERLSGALLILIGLLIGSGRLQSLSQTFSRGEFADFTFRLEECGLGYLEGKLFFSHVGDCLSGRLLPVAINQSASGYFAADSATMQYVFLIDEAINIDLEARGIGDEPLRFRAEIFAPDESLIATGESAKAPQIDGKLIPLSGVALPAPGLYRAVVSADETNETQRFRFKARKSRPMPLMDIAPSNEAASADASLLSDLGAIAADLGPAIGLTEGNRPPDFSITTVDGVDIQLSQLRGKVVLLNFWGTWCGPCRREMPEFQKFYDEWHESGFEILAVAWNDSEDAIRDFRDEFSLTFPLALDVRGDINKAYAIQTRPSSFILARDGSIHSKRLGIMTEPQLRELFRELFAEA